MPGPTPTGNVFQDSTNLVFDGWNENRERAEDWLSRTNDAITDLDTVMVEPVEIAVNYDVGAYAPSFTRPEHPAEPDDSITVSPTLPEDPTLDPIVARELGDAPEEPDLAPYIDLALPTAPTDPVPTAPSVNVALEEIDVPDRPDFTSPEMGELFAITLPTFEAIVIPEFDGQRPTFDIEMPEDGALAWSEQAHVSALQDAIKTALSTMLQGGLGLPLAVEQAIFDRGRAREDRLSRRLISEIEVDMASRGLSEPTGVLAKRLKEAHYENREKTAGLNRDLSIERFKEAVEGMRQAVVQGIALETQLIQQTNAINERALRAVLAVREYMINRVNALISYANLQQQAYATDAQVWKNRIDGELSKLEKTRLELQAQQLVGELNKNEVAIFQARWEAVRNEIEAYRADLEGAKVRSAMNTDRLEQGKLLLQRYDTQVNAWGKRWEGYKAQVDASLGRGKFAESLAAIYATQMQGYKTKGEAFWNEGKFALDRNQQTIALFDAQLRRSDQDLKSQVAVLDASLRRFASRVELYQADAQITQYESAALDRAVQMKIEIEKNRTAVALEAAGLRKDQAIAVAGILVEQVKAKAQALSNLLASSQAGVHLGATIGANGSASYNHSRSVSWAGEAADFLGTEVFY